jgi:hypothetical protein
LIKILIFSSTNAIYAQSWIKATNLNDGDTIIFVCESAKVELSGFNDTNGKATSYTDSPKGLYKFKVIKNDSKVNFQSCDNQKYLIGTNNNNSNLGLNSSKNYWNVEFENNTTILRYYYSTNIYRYLRCYTDATIQAFRMYTSKSNESEVSIYVAKYGKQSRKLYFESLEYTTDLNETFVSPTLKGETQGVTYSSSNESVATVDPTTGHVTIKSIGTTIITAYAPATDSYYEGEASYKLSVTDNAEVNTFTINFTNKEKLQNWGIILPQERGNSSALPTLYDNEVKLTFTHGTSTQTSIYNSNNNYSLRLYKGGGSVTFSVPDAYEITEIIINGDGLKNGNFPKSTSYYDDKASWKGNAQSITYASNDGGTCIINTIQITYKPCTTRPTSKKVKISTNGLATFSSAHSWIVPEGLVAATATANGDILHLKKSYWPGDIIPPYTGVILLGEADEYTLEAPTNNETGNEEINNDLRAAVTNLKINADENCKLYILANDPTHGIGFYFQGTNNDGSYIQHIAEKAYLQLPNSSNISCLRLQLTPTTSIETNLHHTQQKRIYNLEGKLIKPVDLRNGLYIVNGKIQYITK